MKKKTYFAAIDLETGGLNDAMHEDDVLIPKGSIGSLHYAILEFALIIYDNSFNQVGEPISFIVNHSKDDLQLKVGEWSKNQFKDTLMKDCLLADKNLSTIEDLAINHLEKNGVTENDEVYLLGNSIRLDMAFISAQMRKLKKRIHYRLLDVSTLKVLLTALYGRDKTNFDKKSEHEALGDIKESVGELQFYINKFII
jgi:oligoribonuclease